jgi:HK97 family phage prohead protease
MKKTFHFQMPIDQKSIELKSDGTLSIKGYASTKDQDRYGDIVDPKAFENTLETFSKNPIMLLQHDANKPIGRFPETSIDSKGLAVVGDVMYDEDSCMKKIQDGIL